MQIRWAYGYDVKSSISMNVKQRKISCAHDKNQNVQGKSRKESKQLICTESTTGTVSKQSY